MKIKKGFTLMELIVTITIVVVLSVISVPVYRGHVDKAKFAEAYALFASIRDAQLRYYSEYRTFLHNRQTCTGVQYGYTDNETVLGIDARVNNYFTLFSPGMGGNTVQFSAYLQKPYSLYKNDAVRYSKLCMTYNLTTGRTIFETN